MAGRWSTDRFPQFAPAVRRLTEQHRGLQDEPLHLALTYLPRRDGQEINRGIFLFEVIGGLADNFGHTGDLFEASFESTPGLSTGFDEPLHLLLTTKRELADALSKGLPLATEVADAVRRGDYEVLFDDSEGRTSLQELKA